MTAYMLGDVPAVPVLVSPARDGRPVDLSAFTEVVAELLTPQGNLWAATAQLVEDPELGDVISVLVPPHLTQPGLHWLRLILTAPATDTRPPAAETFRHPIVVEVQDGWHTLASARAEWEDAEELSDVRLYRLLAVAKVECIAWARPWPAGELPPVNLPEGQLLHARNRNAAWRVDPVNGSDDSTFNIGAHPMDWVVKQILRPAYGARVVL